MGFVDGVGGAGVGSFFVGPLWCGCVWRGSFSSGDVLLLFNGCSSAVIAFLFLFEIFGFAFLFVAAINDAFEVIDRVMIILNSVRNA